MTTEAGSHATVELLSAYLDQELVAPEARQLEAHLAACAECHVRLEGLRQVVMRLHRLENVDTPLGLDQAVARRIALAGERESLLDAFEQKMSIFTRQSQTLSLFAVVLALAVIIYLFASAVERSSLTPVILNPPDAPPAAVAPEAGSERRLAGRLLRWSGDVWIEDGVAADAVARSLAFDSTPASELLAAHPELAELASLGAPAVVRVDGEVVELR